MCASMIEYQANPSDYSLLAVIGRGCNEAATISMATHVPSGASVAIRRINLEECDIDFTTIQHEILMGRQMHHPNIITHYCSFVHNNELWSVMPLMAFGSCRDLLHAHFRDGLPELVIAYILRDVLQAIEYLHQYGIVHRSLRASHILVSATGATRISGLRHSYNSVQDGRKKHIIHEYPDHFTQNLLWASPELLGQNLAGYNTKTDIYSLGITACELANGCVPFADMPPTEMLLDKLDGVMPNLLDSSTVADTVPEENNIHTGDQGTDNTGINGNSVGQPEITNPYQRSFSQHYHNFVETCLQLDPEKRLSASMLLQHPFFRQLKRKSGSESVPDLLHPVSPLTAINVPKDDLLDSLAQDFEAQHIEDDWNF